MKNSARLSRLTFCALGLWACDGAPDSGREGPATVEAPTANASTLIAQGQEASGYQLEIHNLGEGNLVFVEMGPVKDSIARLSDTDLNTLSPSEAFAKALPGAKVPDVLKGFRHASPSAKTGEVEIDDQSPITQAATSSGPLMPTGLPDCPKSWTLGNASFENCTNSYNRSNYCLNDAAWAFHSRASSNSGNASVCAHSGTAQLQITEGSAVKTFNVPQGQWANFKVTATLCAWYDITCTTKSKFIKFDLRNVGAIAQFGSSIVKS